MSLEEKLTAAMQKALNEGLESSQDMIQSNAAQSFDDMGMASTNPGEFSPEEITNKENLVNAACMSNDTDFEGKATNQPNNSNDNSLLGAVNNIMNDLVDISADSHCDDENCKENELHILEFGESSVSKIIDKILGGKTCIDYLRENVTKKVLAESSNYAGPLDFVPDTRISVSDVVKALKNKIGEGSEAIHVDQVYDEQKNNAYKVSQIDKNKLPKKIQVENVLLELDNDTYKVNKVSDSFPLAR